MGVKYFRNVSGEYLGAFDGVEPPPGSIEVPAPPEFPFSIWGGENWLPPVVTEDQMRESEIAQDKQYLADTDWIVAKIGEASLMGHDITQLIIQYSEQIESREQARIRIRINEDRISSSSDD